MSYVGDSVDPALVARVLDQYIQQLQITHQSFQQGLQSQLNQVASGARNLTDVLFEDQGGEFTLQDSINNGRAAVASIQGQLTQARAMVGQSAQGVADFFRSSVLDSFFTKQLPAVGPALEAEGEALVTTIEENPTALVTIPVAVGAARAAAGGTLRSLVAGGIRGSYGGWAGIAAGVAIAALLALGGWAWSNSGSSGGNNKTVPPTAPSPNPSTVTTLPTTSTTYPLYQPPPGYTVPPSVPQRGGPSQPGTTPTSHVIICDPVEPHPPCVPSSS